MEFREYEKENRELLLAMERLGKKHTDLATANVILHFRNSVLSRKPLNFCRLPFCLEM